MLNERREWVPATPRKSYEQVALESAVDTVRELVEVLRANPDAEDKKRTHGVNRAYSALDHLQRIDV